MRECGTHVLQGHSAVGLVHFNCKQVPNSLDLQTHSNTAGHSASPTPLARPEVGVACETHSEVLSDGLELLAGVVIVSLGQPLLLHQLQ